MLMVFYTHKTSTLTLSRFPIPLKTARGRSVFKPRHCITQACLSAQSDRLCIAIVDPWNNAYGADSGSNDRPGVFNIYGERSPMVLKERKVFIENKDPHKSYQQLTLIAAETKGRRARIRGSGQE